MDSRNFKLIFLSSLNVADQVELAINQSLIEANRQIAPLDSEVDQMLVSGEILPSSSVFKHEISLRITCYYENVAPGQLSKLTANVIEIFNNNVKSILDGDD